MTFENIGFIGLGLIGGSVAKALRRVYPDLTITAYNRNHEVLDMAVRDGTVSIASDESLEAFSGCDIIFLCVPVVTALQFMDRLTELVRPGTILTDVGSVKGEIHRYIEERGLTDRFIGGHPMAGSEKTGYTNASDRLVENAWYIMTPSAGVPKEKIKGMKEMLESIGALPLIMDYREHDKVTAAISHLPHVISASLVNLVHDLDGPEEYMRTIAAGGFRDITRISSSSPQMWQEICLSNPDNICYMLDKYIAKLLDYRHAVGNEDAEKLLHIFSDCKDYRDSFDTKAGSVLREFRIYLDLIDEAGSIATVATILAVNAISIKNIGIVHNREFEQGVLRIVFYNEESMLKAISLLGNRGYTIYHD
ncbi:MAG TPA: prephenate dehydrogenase/arogenate dehydrogenase family protein [Lachnospiraceae bacterium]|nr:prephenate dehydrogenase/arogenate dehydrogenase family protein [Lachnospiraceae bacterium]